MKSKVLLTTSLHCVNNLPCSPLVVTVVCLPSIHLLVFIPTRIMVLLKDPLYVYMDQGEMDFFLAPVAAHKFAK